MVFDWFTKRFKGKNGEDTPLTEAETTPTQTEPDVSALGEMQPEPTVALGPPDREPWHSAESLVVEQVEADELDLEEEIEEDEEDDEEGFRWSEEILAAQGRDPNEISLEERTWVQKLRSGLGRTRQGLVAPLLMLMNFMGKGPIQADQLDDLETILLQADVGVQTSEKILQALKQQTIQAGGLKGEQVVPALKQLLREELEVDDPFFAPQRGVLNVWLIVGVNGVGKTTTIGKIAHLAKKSDYKTLIAAADTFRAAAVEQVKVWGERAGVEVIANPQPGADPAAVVFDAVSAAQARGTELLLVDTAGRLQNKKNLMEELAKIRRVIDKRCENANIEALLVLDATTGQNGLNQARIFTEVANLSGIALTKLDGTAKGGIAIAIVGELGLPIRFIGVGEGMDDLRPFSSYEFVEALLAGV
ncbi:signal recognition particle-docking protein FtsY [Anthocerotibacter panamensis]|uniref:signal recognition particle-docking protein FtsY n=1 Tax=Anthocerotibacter panamensis TaxID=2857077 RepID=UPI001C407FC8|nr:signal recognition particle-docking protein FtsY [Anthocerotibacter panamensis]